MWETSVLKGKVRISIQVFSTRMLGIRHKCADTLGPWGPLGTLRDTRGQHAVSATALPPGLLHVVCVFSSSWCATRWKEWGDTDPRLNWEATPQKVLQRRAPPESLGVGQLVGESVGVTSTYCVWSLSPASRERIYIKNSNKNKHLQRVVSIFL